LEIAAMDFHLSVVEELLATAADIEKTDKEGWASLMVAAKFGFEPVKTLLDYGSKIDAKDLNGNTALMLSSANNHQIVVEFSG
jgi:ankyrin repeat protein